MTITYNVDPVVPTAYIEKPPFPARIKDHAKASTVGYIRAPKPPGVTSQISILE